MPTKLKKEHKDRVVGFNNSSLPLGEREDLDLLAEIGVRSGDKSILDLFETLPTLKELEKAKAAKFLSETSTLNTDDKNSSNGKSQGESESGK